VKLAMTKAMSPPEASRWATSVSKKVSPRPRASTPLTFLMMSPAHNPADTARELSATC
jgi:hypothetical protein